jgi:ADP-sugar diphosphatase
MALTLDFRGVQIPVAVTPPPDTAGVLSHQLVTDWLSSLDPSLDLQSLELQSVDRFSTGRIGFIKFKATVVCNGVRIPGICVLRGDAVALLLQIRDSDTGELWTVLTRQPRVPTGRLLLEIPAGMVDGSGNVRGVAIKELEEECGLVAKPEDLIDLTELAYGAGAGVYTSPGLVDEKIKLFLWRTVMTHQKLSELNGRIGGDSPHEQITLKLIKFEDLWKATADGKALCALALLKGLEGEGRLPN